MEKSIPGLAMEADTAFVEQNGQIKYIKSKEDSKAYIVRNVNGTMLKKQLEMIMIS